VLFLACTVRNQETLDAFMQLLSKYHGLITCSSCSVWFSTLSTLSLVSETMDLEANEEDMPAPTVLSYLTDVPVKIYRISARM
jgi:hypothetical protein